MTDPLDELQPLAAIEPPDALDTLVLERAHCLLQALDTSSTGCREPSKASPSGVLLLLRRRGLR